MLYQSRQMLSSLSESLSATSPPWKAISGPSRQRCSATTRAKFRKKMPPVATARIPTGSSNFRAAKSSAARDAIESWSIGNHNGVQDSELHGIPEICDLTCSWTCRCRYYQSQQTKFGSMPCGHLREVPLSAGFFYARDSAVSGFRCV